MIEQQEQTEFYSPFAHIEGRYEACRIHSPSHGSFDTFIVIHSTTDQPVTVYVNSENGQRFMAQRYPECSYIRLGAEELRLSSSPDGRTVRLELNSDVGPVRRADLVFSAIPDSLPQESSYGSEDFRVWGSGWSCSGVDLNLAAKVYGSVYSQSSHEVFSGSDNAQKAIVTAGSYGRIKAGDWN